MSLGNKLYKLRTKEKMSQEAFAETLGVSRRTVQKWERDLALPETPKLIKISKLFGVSIDNLLLDTQTRMTEEMKNNEEITPCFEKIAGWEFYASALYVEYRQSIDEGLDIERYKELFDVVSKLPQDGIKKELGDVLHKIVMSAPYREDYKYLEPSDLEKIKTLRKGNEPAKAATGDLYDKILGAWIGRISGCMLGKTVEGIRTHELVDFLRETDNYPMVRYITRSDTKKVDLEKYSYGFSGRSYADEIDCMPVDDDTNYTVLAQQIYEKYGETFTPENVAAEWVASQPKDAYCTAERVAFCNFVKGYRPPQSAVHKNPYREWIGAQIRADYWGYVNPGDPEKAAEMAWRDASISHVKNGIYGEMFVSAMIAEAAVTSDISEIIRTGLSQIPYTSRLYEDISQVVEMFESGKTQKATFEYIHSRYDEGEGYGWCHTNSNAMIVAASLLYGGGDFGRSVCMAVETGFDTDCNGATVGSVLGMANGIKSIDDRWSIPFNDTLDTSIFGVGRISITAVAKKTMEHIERAACK